MRKQDIQKAIEDREPVTLFFDYEESFADPEYGPEVDRVLSHFIIGVHEDEESDYLVLTDDDAVQFLTECLRDFDMQEAYEASLDNNPYEFGGY
jgi:hypothetical protein